MAKIVGVSVSERMSAGLVVDHKLVGELRRFPEQLDDKYALVEMPTEGLVRTICEQVVLAADGTEGIYGGWGCAAGAGQEGRGGGVSEPAAVEGRADRDAAGDAVAEPRSGRCR